MKSKGSRNEITHQLELAELRVTQKLIAPAKKPASAKPSPPASLKLRGTIYAAAASTVLGLTGVGFVRSL